MATIDTIKEVLQENLDIDPETVAEDSTLESLGIDSLDMVELICELEERRKASTPSARWSPTSTACNNERGKCASLALRMQD